MIRVFSTPLPKIYCLGCRRYFLPWEQHDFAACCQHSAWLAQQERDNASAIYR